MTATGSSRGPILVVDDEEGVLFSVKHTLRQAGFPNVMTCRDSRRVAGILARHPVALMILDLFMPHMTGEEVLAAVARDYPEVPVIIVTGGMEVKTAVACMKTGAFDYMTKPVEDGALAASVNRALAFRELARENQALKQGLLSPTRPPSDALSGIITNNAEMLSIFKYMEAIADTSHTVLVTGETGTGKEMIAQALHRLSGRAGELVTVNVAGLDDHVFSDTLFGHARGAYTGADRERAGLVETARGGTLVLDEIGELSPSSQVKLLRFIQNGEYFPLGQDSIRFADVRIIALTNQDIWALSETGHFRKDLAFRLHTHYIHLPPLRQRQDDLPLLVAYFMDEAARGLGKRPPTFPPEIFSLMGAYAFPGNIRELKAMITDAVSRHKNRVMSLDVFKTHMARQEAVHSPGPHDSRPANTVVFPATLPTIKATTDLLVDEAMKRSGGNRSVAARMLGISPQALGKRLNKGRRDKG